MARTVAAVAFAALAIGQTAALTVADIDRAPASLRATAEAARKRSDAESFVKNIEYKHILRVCNAYPLDVGLDVFDGKDKLTASPLAYKQCDEYQPKLNAGDRIDFKTNGDTAGTFTIDELPATDATLLMVIYRHDAESTAVSFESHVFSGVASPQVAVIDTYKGAAKSELRIKDVKPLMHNETRSELLRFESVVALNSGQYEVALQKDKKNNVAPEQLVALPAQSYVVIRVGVDAADGTKYPEEVMVYPHSDKMKLPSGALPSCFVRLWALALVLTVTTLVSC